MLQPPPPPLSDKLWILKKDSSGLDYIHLLSKHIFPWICAQIGSKYRWKNRYNDAGICGINGVGTCLEEQNFYTEKIEELISKALEQELAECIKCTGAGEVLVGKRWPLVRNRTGVLLIRVGKDFAKALEALRKRNISYCVYLGGDLSASPVTRESLEERNLRTLAIEKLLEKCIPKNEEKLTDSLRKLPLKLRKSSCKPSAQQQVRMLQARFLDHLDATLDYPPPRGSWTAAGLLAATIRHFPEEYQDIFRTKTEQETKCL